MARVTEQDVRHLGVLARLRLEERELAVFVREIEPVLSYATSLVEIAKTAPVDESLRTATPDKNVMRADVVQQFDSQPLLDQAPEGAEGYYIVPKILSR